MRFAPCGKVRCSFWLWFSTLGLGIGANTTVFTLINTLILNPLPVPDSSGLVAVGAAKAESTSKSGLPLPISFADLKDYQARNEVFHSLAGYTSSRLVTWQADGRFAADVWRIGDGELLLDFGPAPRQGTILLCPRRTALLVHTLWQ